MIGIIDYKVGNIQAFLNVFKKLDVEAFSISSPDQVDQADKLILPGVGHFDFAMSKFLESGLKTKVEQRVLIDGVPVLGVCVGMQMLANTSEEGNMPGLGWIPGEVKRFTLKDVKTKPHVPHMGWNTVRNIKNHPILEGLDETASFYFLHSFYFSCEEDKDRLLLTQYGIEYTSMAHRNNVFGAQFHPEKSHSAGVQLLKNFSEI